MATSGTSVRCTESSALSGAAFGEQYELRDTFGLGLTDGEFFRQTIPLLLEQAEPFMTVLLTQSNHYQYVIPQRHRAITVGHAE